MFILLCSPHSFLVMELLTTSLILISFFFFFVALSLKSPTRGVSINYRIVLYCKVVVESFSVATTVDMEDFNKNVTRKEADSIIINVGTNEKKALNITWFFKLKVTRIKPAWLFWDF